MANKVTSKTAVNKNQILFDVMNRKAVSIIVDATAGTVDSTTGKKIVKAGTPLAGDLMDRTKAFKKPTATASVAEGGTTTTTAPAVQGVLLYDVDVTAGSENGSLLIWGFVNLDRLDTSVVTEIKAQQSALDGKIWLLADN